MPFCARGTERLVPHLPPEARARVYKSERQREGESVTQTTVQQQRERAAGGRTGAEDGRGHQDEAGDVPHGALRRQVPQPEPDQELLAELPGLPPLPEGAHCQGGGCDPLRLVLEGLQIPVPFLLDHPMG
ncbi:hypothetical protein Z043_119499 [Scleropages formosus]|uniref:Uncharacterized protein n=1 Tax=Scleropages formosus TaxID=113540 RepID=A0A0P7TMM0_SCLFO|nr:hypothetical protein Z043_119499 [Scleropages formosus]